jgi:uncharacterized protein YjiS (DUF1127 family)
MFEVMKVRIHGWRRRRNTAAELRALSDRDLLDIGISRYDINSIAEQASQHRR